MKSISIGDWMYKCESCYTEAAISFNSSSYLKLLWKISVLWILERNKLKSLKNMCEEVHFS